jgi:putative ABC transport system ATP-binding protein
LDQDNRDGFMRLLLQVVEACNATLIFVSHDQGLAEHFPVQLELSDLNRAGRAV